jgi:hypothetical protein
MAVQCEGSSTAFPNSTTDHFRREGEEKEIGHTTQLYERQKTHHTGKKEGKHRRKEADWRMGKRGRRK